MINLIRETYISVKIFRVQNFPCLKLIEIVILWVDYTIAFGINLFWHFFLSLLSTFYTTCLAKDH